MSRRQRSPDMAPMAAKIDDVREHWDSVVESVALEWKTYAARCRARGEPPRWLDDEAEWNEVAAALKFGGGGAARQAMFHWRNQWVEFLADASKPLPHGLTQAEIYRRVDQMLNQQPSPAGAPAEEGSSNSGANSMEVEMRLRKFLGSYLKKEDVPQPQLLTISAVKEEQVGHGESSDTRAVCYFEEVEKGLVLNVTTINTLEALFGTDESDAFAGKKVVLYADPEVQYQGKRVGGLRLRAPRNQARPAAPPHARTAPAAAPPHREEAFQTPTAQPEEFPPAESDTHF